MTFCPFFSDRVNGRAVLCVPALLPGPDGGAMSAVAGLARADFKMHRIAHAVRPFEAVLPHNPHNLFSIPGQAAVTPIARRDTGHINGEAGFVQ